MFKNFLMSSKRKDYNRKESVAYTLQYVLSSLDKLGAEDVDSSEGTEPDSKPVSVKAKIDLSPVLTTLRAIGEIHDFQSKKELKPIPYSLEFILATLEALGEADDEDDEEWDYELNNGLSEKQVSSKQEIENIVTTLSAFERDNSSNDLEMLLTESESLKSLSDVHSQDKGKFNCAVRWKIITNINEFMLES